MLKNILEKIYTKLTEPEINKAKKLKYQKDIEAIDRSLRGHRTGKQRKNDYATRMQKMRWNQDEFEFTVKEVHEKWAWLKKIINIFS